MTDHVGEDYPYDLSQHTLFHWVICRLQARMDEIGHPTCCPQDRTTVDASWLIHAVPQKRRTCTEERLRD
jgi:hypothetical protein